MSINIITCEALHECVHLYAEIMTDIGTYLLHNSAIAIFLCLAIGYILGKVKIKSFTVGATVGTLITGLLISFIFAPLGHFTINPLVKSIFFTLFIFTIGYEVGPAFFKSLKDNGIKVVILSTFFAAVAFILCYVTFKILGIGPGEAAGIIAGALTQSAVLGTASETIKTLMTGQAQAEALSELPIAYAITYVFGTVGVIVFMKNIAPKLLGVNLKEETGRKILATGFKEATASTALSPVTVRAFKVNSDSGLINRTVASIESDYNDDLSIEAIFRNEQKVEFTPETVVTQDDILTVIGDIEAMVKVEQNFVTETSETEYLRVAPKKSEVVLTKKYKHEVLGRLAQQGVVIVSAVKGGQDIRDYATLEPGDVITLAGPESAVKKAAKGLGYIKDTGTVTDVSFMSLGIVLGLLIGALCFKISGIPITLGGGGGALVGGLIFGWYRGKNGRHGLIPPATRWFLKSVGLNLFIAVVGLTAGSTFLEALAKMGWLVLLLGVLITLIPHIASVLFGHYVLKMDAVDIIGGLCGAGTCTAALNGVIDETGSSIYAMGYTPGYAVGNILITVLGPLIVSVLL